MIVYLTSFNKEQYFDIVFNFCKNNFNNNISMQNYDFVDWENKPNTLLYLLYIEKRFDECGYGVYIEDNKILAGTGMYRSEINPLLFIFACRALKDVSCRGYHNTFMRQIWAEQVKILKEKKAIGIIITYDMNKEQKMYNLFKKNEKLLKSSRLINNNIPELQNLKILDYPLIIKGTKQRIVYKFFDDSITWSSLGIRQN